MRFARGRIDEPIEAFRRSWANRSLVAVILTGTGDRVFCTVAITGREQSRAT